VVGRQEAAHPKSILIRDATIRLCLNINAAAGQGPRADKGGADQLASSPQAADQVAVNAAWAGRAASQRTCQREA